MNDRTRSIVIWTVTAVWGANFLMGLLASFIPSIHYEVRETYNAIFMAIVGGLFTVDRLLLNRDRSVSGREGREVDDSDGATPLRPRQTPGKRKGGSGGGRS